MSNLGSSGFTSLVGPLLNEVELRPVEVNFVGQATTPTPRCIPTPPPVVAPASPAVLKPGPVKRFSLSARRLFSRLAPLFSRAGTELVRPFNLTVNDKIESFTFLALAAFLVWLGYGAVPGLAEAMPLSSFAGIIYFGTLLPASLFSSSLVLALGRVIGWGLERLVGYIRK